MFRNYLKVALRNIIRHKGYSIINVAGLAIGMACALLILLWIQDELSYDRFHQNADRLHLVALTQRLETGQQTIPTQQAPLGPLLKENIPEISECARFREYSYTLAYDERTFQEEIYFADPSFLTMFSFPLIQGDPATALEDPHSILLTETMTRKYFGENEPVGKVLRLNEQVELTVTGIMRDVPHNSTIQFECLAPFALLQELGYRIDEWLGNDYLTFVLLEERTSYRQVGEKINAFCSDLYRQEKGVAECPYTMFLHPVTEAHLHPLGWAGGRIDYVYIFALAAALILIIACMNFINISTARSVNRAKEICLRKVVGANRAQLGKQLLGESILLSLIAAAVAVTFAEFLLPVFNYLAGKELSLVYSNPALLVGLLTIVILTGILSGMFPAIYLSAFQPVKVLKGHLRSSRSALHLRRILVVFQFALSLVLIIATIVISSQIAYINNKDLGLNKENVLYLVASQGIKEHYATFKKELKKNPKVVSVTAAAQGITHINSTLGNNWGFDGRDPNQKLEVHFDWVSLDYAETFGLKMAEGRFYSEEFPSDLVDGIVLNEKAVELMGIEDPIGKRFSYWGNDKRIIGVVKDFHLEPLHETLKPMILIYQDFINYVYIRIAPDDASQVLSYIETVYKRLEPGGTFEYGFLDDRYKREYRTELRLASLSRYATALAILIACLGLFGLASFMAEQRTKEIGVRKVLGASVTSIVRLMSKEFVVLVVVAILIASPVAYYAMNKWLEHFAYRTGLGWWVFVTGGLLALLITLITVGFQAVKAALTNPVETLRYE
jgi:putative ABC transport system permease protein